MAYSDHDCWLARGPEDAPDTPDADWAEELKFRGLALTPEGQGWIPFTLDELCEEAWSNYRRAA